MENMNIKTWYKEEYPTDTEINYCNDNITFYDVFLALDKGMDIYELLGNGDSLIRERIFMKLAEIMQVDYSYIYNQWLGV